MGSSGSCCPTACRPRRWWRARRRWRLRAKRPSNPAPAWTRRRRRWRVFRARGGRAEKKRGALSPPPPRMGYLRTDLNNPASFILLIYLAYSPDRKRRGPKREIAELHAVPQRAPSGKAEEGRANCRPCPWAPENLENPRRPGQQRDLADRIHDGGGLGVAEVA